MLPASNRGVGMNLCFPDICNTPTPAGPVPIPYPNIALNVQAVGFSPFVKVSMMNALNLGSKIPMTTGDEAGSASPIKGAGGFTMGNPIVMIDKMPGIMLTSLATGNNMNAPIGAAIVPSIVNVFYTLARGSEAARTTLDGDPHHRIASLDEARDLVDAGDVEVTRDAASLSIRIARLGLEVPGRVLVACERAGLPSDAEIVLDLRGCPGGELDAFLALTEMFLPEGALLATIVDEDGDEIEHRGRGGELAGARLSILVDSGTASAAELVAGALRAHGRARILGDRTYGKSSAQCLRTTAAGGSVLATSSRVILPGGVELEGAGIQPDAPIALR